MSLSTPPQAQTPVYRVLDGVSKLCMGVAGVQIVTLIIIFGWLVYGRYILNATPTWVEQMSLLLVVWITFLGAATGVWKRAHLAVDLFRDIAPPRVSVFLFYLAQLMMLVICAALVIYGIQLAQSTWARRIPILNIAEGWRAVPMAISGALSFVFVFYQTVERAMRHDNTRD